MEHSAGEQAARDALRKSVERNRMQVDLAQETIAVIRHEIRDCVKEVITDALSEGNAEKFWAVGLTMLRRQTAEKTGTFVGGMAMALLRRGIIFMILGGVVYAIGGWTALAALWKSLASHD